MAESLKKQTVSGIIWTGVQQFSTMGISFLSNIVLARLLSPDDYGCIGILAIFIVVATLFVNGGFAAALVQKKNPTNEDYCTVFYWNIAVSAILYGILYFSAPLIAQFYKIAMLSDVLRVQGIILFINALSIVQQNILRKELKFKKLSYIQLTSVIISVAIAISLAYNGFGVWALVIQQLALGIITTIILWMTAKWHPALCFSTKSFKELFSYGAYMLMSDILNGICDNIQGLIIGRRYSVTDMGYYSQAKRLETVPTQSISNAVSQVIFPVFSKIQDDKDKLYTATRKGLRSMNFFNIPLMMLLITIADSLLVLLYSEKWIESIPYFRILCVAGLVNCMQSINYQLVCAVGKSKVMFRWNMVKRICGLLFILGGMYWGIFGMMWGMVLSFYFTYIVNAMLASSYSGYTLCKQVVDAVPVLAISIVASLVTYYMQYLVDAGYAVIIIIQILVFAIVYFGLAKLFRFAEVEEYIRIAKSYLKR